MAQEKPNRLAEWVVLVRVQIPVWRHRTARWFDAVRDEPILVWHTPAIRYGVYAAGGALGAWMLVTAATMFLPAPPEGAKPEAVKADYHVVCTDPDCGAHFVVHREFGFRRFPVECPACRLETGARAVRCHSSTCQGRWASPIQQDDVQACSRCGRPVE